MKCVSKTYPGGSKFEFSFMSLMIWVTSGILFFSLLHPQISDKISDNPIFENYFQKLALTEWELLSLEPSQEIVEKSQGDLSVFFNLYRERLENIQRRVALEGDLSPLEKRTLDVYADFLIAHQVYSSEYMVLLSTGDPRTEKVKQDAISTQDRIIANLQDKIPPGQGARVKSFLLSLYAENMFLSIDFRKGDFFTFVHESHTLLKEALGHDPDNYRAAVWMGYFYTATAELDPLNSSIADRYYDRVVSIIPQDPTTRYLLLYALVGKSQAAITRGDYSTAQKHIQAARNLAPKSGYLSFVQNLLDKRRTLFNYSREQFIRDSERDKTPLNFFYSYSIQSSGAFLYKNYFNFIVGDHLWTLFLNAGNSFYPASGLFEEGVRIGFNRWSLEVGSMQNPIFTEGVGTYTGFLGLQVKQGGFLMNLRGSSGLFYDYQPKDDDFFLQNHLGIEAKWDWSLILYHSSKTRLFLQQSTRYRYSLDLATHTLSSDVSLPWTLFDHRWGEIYTVNGVSLGYSSKPDSIRNRVDFFEKSPLSLGKLAHRIKYYDTPMSGTLLFHHALSYRFYPLVFMDRPTPAKGLFIAPTVYVGTVIPNPGKWDGSRPNDIVTSFSIVGNLGYRFPGDMTISLGGGWNDRDGVVLNILMY